MRSRSLRCVLSWVLGLVASAACGAEPDAVEGYSPASSPSGADASVSGVAGTCTTGQSEACTCLSDGTPIPGMRSCAQGTWAACSCSSAPPAPVQEECLPGRYEGSFSGLYSSGFAAGFPIPVVALDLSGKPGLAFTLLKSNPSGAEEFATYTISDGYVDGVADGVFPFKGKLTGTLDCKTKQFVGELDGGYSILLPLGLNEGTFKGPVTGTYDPATHSFTLGTWSLREGEEVVIDILADAGGDGEWDAKYVGP